MSRNLLCLLPQRNSWTVPRASPISSETLWDQVTFLLYCKVMKSHFITVKKVCGEKYSCTMTKAKGEHTRRVARWNSNPQNVFCKAFFAFVLVFFFFQRAFSLRKIKNKTKKIKPKLPQTLQNNSRKNPNKTPLRTYCCNRAGVGYYQKFSSSLCSNCIVFFYI